MTTGEARPQPGAKYLLLATTIFLAFGGLLMIFSASAWTDFTTSTIANSYYHLIRQGEWLAVGLCGLFLCSRFSTRFTRAIGWWVLLGADAVLVLVLTPLGVGKWGAVRAIELGFVTLQPAEFAKLGCVLVMAGIMADRASRSPGPLRDDVIKGCIAFGVPFALLMMQPDMGMAMSLAFAVVIVLVLGGLPGRYIAATLGAGAVAVPVLVQLNPHVGARINSWIGSFVNPGADIQGAGFQSLMARYAFASGGLLGVGLGMSRMKGGDLPAAYTDFIFAIIGEELGLLGSAAVVLAFGLLCYAGVRLALSTKDVYARLVAAGLTAMIVTQAIISMASVTGLIPVAGEPLPFVSYGGSSLVLNLACVGLILAASRGGEARVRVAAARKR